MDLKLKRTPGLFLVGFMASGKSTAGPLLAQRLGWRYTDIDAAVEQQQGTTIREIFHTRGEPAFRELETAAIEACVQHIRKGIPWVVALGGGAFIQERNWDLVRRHGFSIWLDCPLNRIQARLAGNQTRPLASDNEAVSRLYETRQQLYARADFRINADCDDPDELVRRIETLAIFR